jgi:hypothetical protein
MPMTLAKSPSTRRLSPPLQQIYVTHCLRSEGLSGEAGFAIRASSTLDPLLLRFALEYPTYELPLGMAGEKRVGPRRLSLVRIPGGPSVVIHSAAVPDERGRANNFFSHYLIRPQVTARAVLSCWGAGDWQTVCSPETGTDLPPLDDLPQGRIVNDKAVTAFLQKSLSPGDEDPALSVCPPRLLAEPKRRRELIRVALRGCLLALQSSVASPRSRFYVLGEPGLISLLLYAAVRLLPEALAANLTFSTYENAHRDLRVYKHARVVGTWLSDPGRGLEADFFTTRGYALDTYNQRFSPELEGGEEPDIEEWIDLAARGEWATIDKVHRLLGKNSTSVASFRESVQAAKIAQRLANERANGEDLLALKRAAWGGAILQEHQDKIWPLLRQYSLGDERLQREYADLLEQNLPELEREAGKALIEQPRGDWKSPWRLICAILTDDLARLREILQRLLPQPPYAAGLRLAFLEELHACRLSPTDPRLPWHVLLKQCTAEELDQLARSALPRDWFALTLLHAFTRTESRTEAVRCIHNGDDELLALFWEQFRLLKEENQRRAILTALFLTDRSQGLRLLDRLLTLRPALRKDTVEWLLNAFGAFRHDRPVNEDASREMAEFWGSGNRLGLLLDLMRNLREEAEPLWERLCSRIDARILVPGDVFQNTVLMEMAAAKDRPGPPLPPKTAQTIADWIVLREHFEKATDVPESTRRQVIDACNRLHVDCIDVLRGYFQRYVLPQGINPVILDDFSGFFHSFFLTGTGHQDHGSRLIGWLDIVGCCPNEAQRADYQRYYLDKHIPMEFRWLLAEETHQAGRLLPVVYEHMRAMRPNAPEAAPTSAAPASTLEPIDESFQLSGTRSTHCGASILERLPWLLPTLLGGMTAVGISSIYQIQMQRVASLVLFVPLVVSLAESTALQALAMTLRLRRNDVDSSAKKSRGVLGKELAAGLTLGLSCGLLAALGVGVWLRSWPLALALGGALTGSMVGAAGMGYAASWLPNWTRNQRLIACGPLARAAAGSLALLLYFALACLLIRR